MTINVSSIKIARTFASLALTTIGIVAVGTFWSCERGKRHIEIVKNRSKEDLETSIMMFASRHKKIPRIAIQGLFILPVIPIIDLLLSYVSMVVHAVNIGHSADMVTTF